MGMFSRMSVVVKSKMNRILDNAEDPRETLDYAYEKQMEMLRNVKRGVVEMVTTKRRLQQQASKVRENVAKLENQAPPGHGSRAGRPGPKWRSSAGRRQSLNLRAWTSR